MGKVKRIQQNNIKLHYQVAEEKKFVNGSKRNQGGVCLQVIEREWIRNEPIPLFGCAGMRISKVFSGN